MDNKFWRRKSNTSSQRTIPAEAVPPSASRQQTVRIDDPQLRELYARLNRHYQQSFELPKPIGIPLASTVGAVMIGVMSMDHSLSPDHKQDAMQRAEEAFLNCGTQIDDSLRGSVPLTDTEQSFLAAMKDDLMGEHDHSCRAVLRASITAADASRSPGTISRF